GSISAATPGEHAADDLAERVGDEDRVVDEISLPQATWFLAEAIDPGKPHALHPGGREGSAAGQQFEGIAHRQENPACIAMPISGDPTFLFDPTEGDPDEVRAGVVNGRGEAGFVFFLPGAERGAERANDLNIGTELAEGGGELIEARFAAPEKIMAAGGGRMTDHMPHEVWAVGAVLQIAAQGIQ